MRKQQMCVVCFVLAIRCLSGLGLAVDSKPGDTVNVNGHIFSIATKTKAALDLREQTRQLFDSTKPEKQELIIKELRQAVDALPQAADQDVAIANIVNLCRLVVNPTIRIGNAKHRWQSLVVIFRHPKLWPKMTPEARDAVDETDKLFAASPVPAIEPAPKVQPAPRPLQR